jgi:hypothetical protein
MRLQETLLRQCLCKIHIAQRCQKKSENLRTMTLNDTRELCRSNLFGRTFGYGLYCCSGCHRFGRRSHTAQVYNSFAHFRPDSKGDSTFKSQFAAKNRANCWR